jgi:[protein-PII] uridylyltransferase
MPIASGLRPSVLAARERLAAGREKIRQRHARGTPGVQVSGALADLFDAIVLDLAAVALADLGEDGPDGLGAQVALVAHGGFGRRDVAPYSDVDLMVLHTGRPERVGRLAERLMRDVFDSGLVLGHSVRSIDEAVALALDEPTICTSLMESRFLSGDLTLYGRFAQRFGQQVRRRAGALIGAIDLARQEERQQYGETVHLLEPNIKRSRGGLRDLQLLRWAGFARYGSADADDLLLRGALSKKDQQTVRQAAEFLLRLRNEMHFQAGKSSDVLDRAEQVRVADLFGYAGEPGLLPVERFMREYFLHTDAISHLVTRFVINARPGSKWRAFFELAFSHQVEGDFRVGPTQISATRRGLAKLKANLDEALRLADLANLNDKRIAHATGEAVREAAADYPDQISPRAAARFVSLLSQPAQLGQLLRFLHETRVLEKFVPALVHARSLLQFNEYHKYTVDEHCLRAVERATEFQQDPGPLGVVYRRIKARSLLHLALLIHDLGKGHAEDHSEVGLRIARETAARLRLSPRETETLAFLVHKHLIMSHLALRRDTSDERLVLDFAVEVGSPEALDMLFVLTAADMAAVGPGVLNNWKIEVLGDLHARAMRHLAGSGPALDAQERLAQRRTEVRAALRPAVEEWHERQIAALPAGYLESRATHEIVADLSELRRLGPREVTARGRWVAESQTVEYTIGTYESIVPGVFHRLTGALTGKGLEILSAEINTLADGLVLDRFFVHDPDHPHQAPPADRLASVIEALRQSLLTPSSTPLVFRRVWRSGQGRDRSGLPALPTVVRADNNTSERFTILDIFAADRRGLLYTIARTLFELDLSVSVAKIGTYLDQVVDVFYVTDMAGRKIRDEDRLEEIRRRLLQEIETVERHESEQAAAR